MYYWLWTTESVDGSIERVDNVEEPIVVTVRQDGQMPSPMVLRVEFVPDAPALAASAFRIG